MRPFSGVALLPPMEAIIAKCHIVSIFLHFCDLNLQNLKYMYMHLHNDYEFALLMLGLGSSLKCKFHKVNRQTEELYFVIVDLFYYHIALQLCI